MSPQGGGENKALRPLSLARTLHVNTHIAQSHVNSHIAQSHVGSHVAQSHVNSHIAQSHVGSYVAQCQDVRQHVATELNALLPMMAEISSFKVVLHIHLHVCTCAHAHTCTLIHTQVHTICTSHMYKHTCIPTQT